MSGGPALGRWEVKDCKVHKALAVCKQNIRSYHDVQLPEHHIDAYAPCPPGWESNSGLLHCFKVRLSSYFFITLNKSPCTLSNVDICFFVLFITLRITGDGVLSHHALCNRQGYLGSHTFTLTGNLFS